MNYDFTLHYNENLQNQCYTIDKKRRQKILFGIFFIKKLKYLVTGSNGQLGSALVPLMQDLYGESNVISTDLQKTSKTKNYTQLDITDKKKYEEIVKENKVTNIVHLAGILSASAEKNPTLCIKVNIDGALCALDLAVKYKSK